MHQGEIIQIGTPKQLYFHPSTLFAARYFSTVNEIPAQRRDTQLETVFGCVAVPENLIELKQPVSCYFRPHQLQVSRTPKENAVAAKVIRASFMGSSYQLQLQLESVSSLLLAQVDHLDKFYEYEQVYVSIDLAASFFFASGAELSASLTSELEPAVQF